MWAFSEAGKFKKSCLTMTQAKKLFKSKTSVINLLRFACLPA